MNEIFIKCVDGHNNNLLAIVVTCYAKDELDLWCSLIIRVTSGVFEGFYLTKNTHAHYSDFIQLISFLEADGVGNHELYGEYGTKFVFKRRRNGQLWLDFKLGFLHANRKSSPWILHLICKKIQVININIC